MAQKVTGYIKLQIEAGKATPAPPVGPALGQKGVNIMAFTKEFNERTKNQRSASADKVSWFCAYAVMLSAIITWLRKVKGCGCLQEAAVIIIYLI